MAAIDTHVHYWDISRFGYSWIPADSPIVGPWYPDSYREATASTRITGHVFVQAGTDSEFVVPEAAWVSSLREADPSILGIVAGWRPGGGNALLQELQAIAGVVGVRIGLGTDEQLPAISADVTLLASAGLAIDLLGRPEHLPLVRAIAETSPDARLIIDHCMKPRITSDQSAVVADASPDNAWLTGIAALADCKNVVCKFSGLGTEVFSPDGIHDDGWRSDDLATTFDAVMNTFGPGRVIYGGDWPVSLRAGSCMRWFAAVDDLVARLPEPERERFWSGNASRVYRLS